MEIEYTPTQLKQQAAPKPEFILVEDVTGKPLPKRGSQILSAVYYGKKNETDKEDSRLTIQFKVPYPPKDNCKKCRGQGYIGFVFEGKDRIPNICRKCYPVTK